MHFFTADEHYNHKNIIKYCNRPFSSIEEMNEELIRRHNIIVEKDDIVIHGGDFTLSGHVKAYEIINRLNGTHVFIQGSHDKWLSQKIWNKQIYEITIEGNCIVVCHYAMRTWPRSHFNSWQLYGHSHGTLEPVGKQYDIGVDNNDFYPISYDKIKDIMAKRPDNPNFIAELNKK